MAEETVSLRSHFEALLAALKEWARDILAERDKRYEQRFTDLEQATQKKAESLDKRFDGVNELRAAMSDAASKYITRNEALALIVAVSTIVGVGVTIVQFVVNFFLHK